MRRLLLHPEVRGAWGAGDARALLAAYERVWDRKSLLRRLYASWYQMILDDLRPGHIVEVGAGTGNFKRWLRSQGRSCQTLDAIRSAGGSGEAASRRVMDPSPERGALHRTAWGSGGDGGVDHAAP